MRSDNDRISARAATDARTFYDSFAEDYHLIFRDWWSSAQWQGDVLGSLLRSRGVAAPATVLDCTCGIGTQALPLAMQGYRLVGADLSARAVERARAEARHREIDVEFLSADVRSLADTVDRRFDAVVSCDNSLPHLLTDADLALALASVRRCLRDRGLFLASIRDYDALVRDQVQGVVPTMHETEGQQRIVGQAWTWAPDHRTVEINLFILQQQESGWAATVRSTTYRALLRHELTTLLASSGFDDIRWSDPHDSGYYQPIVTALAA